MHDIIDWRTVCKTIPVNGSYAQAVRLASQNVSNVYLNKEIQKPITNNYID